MATIRGDIAKAGAAPRVECRGLLYMVRVVQPDALARAAAVRLGWLGHPAARIAAIALVALAMAVAVASVDEIRDQIAAAWKTRAMAWALALSVAAALFHESAHALAAVRSGARLTAAGFGVYYFRPCLFCEIRGMQSLPRAQRLLVSGAGPISDLVFASIAIVGWRLLPPGMLAATLLLLSALLGLRVVINVNPLIKLDGYYLLVDIIDRPDLREAAFRTLRQMTRSPWSALADRTHLTRAWLSEVVYAVLATGYIAGVLIAIAWTFGGWLRTMTNDTALMVVTVAVLGVASRVARLLRADRRRHDVAVSTAGARPPQPSAVRTKTTRS